MKMTMHIDEEVLDRVMKITGAKTKRAAVEIALKDMARRHRLKEKLSEGLGLTPDQLANLFPPHPSEVWDRPIYLSPQKVAEDPTPYGGPPAAS